MIDVFYLLRGIVYAQSFIWLYLLDKKIEINNRYIRLSFPISLGLFYLILDITGFEFSQYTNELLKVYTILMLYSYFILRNKYGFKNTVSLNFLVVFINSYYWEFMLHLNVIMFYGLSFNQFIQALHLIPVFFLYRMVEIKDNRRTLKLICYGLVISTLNLLFLNLLPLNLFGFIIMINRGLINNITRFLCLSILLIISIKQIKIKKE